MKIETRISIGDIVLLFGDPNWRTVCTAILVRASGQIEYQLEWSQNGELKSEWIADERIKCLARIYGKGKVALGGIEDTNEIVAAVNAAARRQ
jgi:hypothetical protein